MHQSKRDSSGQRSRRGVGRAKRSNGLFLGAIAALGAGCGAEPPMPSPGQTGGEENLGEKTQAFNPSPSLHGHSGHARITKKALDLLAARGMLPELLKQARNQALVVYGNNFGDHPSSGWPAPDSAGQEPRQAIINHMTARIPRNGRVVLDDTADGFEFDAVLNNWDDPTVTVTGEALVGWVPGKVDLANDLAGKKFSDSARFQVKLTVDADLAVDGLVSAGSCVLSLIGVSDCGWKEPPPQTEPFDFAMDNMYHYALGDLRDIGIPIDESDTSMRLYPFLPEHVPHYNDTATTRDVAMKLSENLQNQKLLTGSDYGALKYGAILYQLSRRFFVGSRQPEPDLAQLVKVGNDVPGWRTGRMQGHGGLNDMRVEFPHTYLGGMPYVCTPANSADPCAQGRPTWPAWIKSTFGGEDRPPSVEELPQLEVARPGRSDRAGLIYLGWATHMMQDASLPHHVGGWTGREHEAQDGLGDVDYYYRDYSRETVPKTVCNPFPPAPGVPPTFPGSKLGPPQWCSQTREPHPYASFAQHLVDTTIKADLDALLGPAGAPKSRSQICSALNVVDSHGSATDLAWRAVYPLFTANARDAYDARRPKLDANEYAAAGAKYVKNAVLGTIKLLLCATPEPPGTGADYWPATFASGFVWSHSPTGSVTALSAYSFNSSGGRLDGTGVDNTITQTATGQYRVDFPGLGTETGGNVQVTAYGWGSERCKVGGWGSDGSTLSVNVLCHDAAGAPVDTLFTASYLRQPRPGADTRSGGYLWADQPTAASYTPSPYYQWNASGARNTIERSGVGNYVATFPGISLSGGTVQVTAYGFGSEHCKVSGWGSNTVYVACFDNAGAPVDTQFTLAFSDFSPSGTPSFHYAWADQPWTESYTPSPFYQRGHLASECSSAGTMTMQRWSPGSYTATIPALSPTGSTVKVTAYGGTADTCKVTGWGGSGTETQVGVACFDPAGQPVDTYFVLVYSTNQYIIC